MPYYDEAHKGELREQISYELWSLEFLRQNLYWQSEFPEATVNIELKEVCERPEAFITYHQTTAYISSCQSAVQEALNRFVPMAFVSAFKVNDMVAEWILGTNGKVPWEFKAKVERYEAVQAALIHPPLLASTMPFREVFWKLYAAMGRLRNAIIHGGGFTLTADGSLQVTASDNTVTTLITSEISSYIRLTCLLTRLLIDDVPPDLREHTKAILPGEINNLSAFHGIVLSSPKPTRLINVCIVAHKESEGSLPVEAKFELDMTLIRKRLEKSYGVCGRMEVLLALEVTAEDSTRRIRWRIPPEHVSRDRLFLAERDSGLRQWLFREEKA